MFRLCFFTVHFQAMEGVPVATATTKSAKAPKKGAQPVPAVRPKIPAVRPKMPKACGVTVHYHTGKVQKSDTKQAWRVFVNKGDRVDKQVLACKGQSNIP